MDLAQALCSIAKLQSDYSSENTPAMQERGRLIRRVVPELLREMEVDFRNALGEFGSTFEVDASDGIGRKTEAPWVRVCANEMSPSAREGFYVVIHFAANGSAIFITVGCGSTIWSDGELRPIAPEELKTRTDWARRIIEEKFGNTAPFSDQIHLGARANLPAIFERATAIAKKVPTESASDADIRKLLLEATIRLRTVYWAQRQGRHLPAAEVGELDVASVVRPKRSVATGQGYALSGPERRAIELRAMALAKEWLVQNGFSVVDRSAQESFDFEATRDGKSTKVEVKGTTNDAADAVLMTKNEVELHTNHRGNTGLIVVHGIRVERENGEIRGLDGRVVAELPWDISAWNLQPVAFRLSRRI
jgi:hypothetical protein